MPSFSLTPFFSDFIDYDFSDALSNRDLDFYNRTVFKLAFPRPTASSMKLRLYFGAAYENSTKIYSNSDIGFPRVALKDIPFLTNNLNALRNLLGRQVLRFLNFGKKSLKYQGR
jgi:hypothetical protein